MAKICLRMAHRNGPKWPFPWDRVGKCQNGPKKWPQNASLEAGNGPKNDLRMTVLEPQNGHFYGVLMAEWAKSRVQNGLDMAVSLG